MDEDMTVLFMIFLAMAFAICATLLWASFFILVGWSIYMLLTSGIWPSRPINFYQTYFDASFGDTLGSTWIGWYLLGAAIIAMLGTLACTTAIQEESRT